MRLRVLPPIALATTILACGEPASTPDAASPDAHEAVDDAALPLDAFEPPPPEVTIEGLGTVRGIHENGARSFYAIPYAEPPVGELRWRAPVARGPWEGVLDGSEKSEACVQSALSFGAFGQEDCLFLNVHTPDPAPTNAPVIVWIHGGAFVFGEGVQTDRGTRGDLIAASHGAIVVSMNYRLGSFGFFVNEATGASGNAGFEDQILALEWVRDHIADFGGNPDDVTIMGESAGGLSVCLHLVAPRSRGLFHRAITESGLCDSALSPEAERLEVSNDLVAALGCDTAPDEAACLRSATAEAVRDASGLDGVFGTLTDRVRPWWPYVDGTVIPQQFRDAVVNDRTGAVPVIVGWNRDEGTLFVDLAERSGVTADEATYRDPGADRGGGALSAHRLRRSGRGDRRDARSLRARVPVASRRTLARRARSHDLRLSLRVPRRRVPAGRAPRARARRVPLRRDPVRVRASRSPLSPALHRGRGARVHGDAGRVAALRDDRRSR
jgi:carboxylesterase type B